MTPGTAFLCGIVPLKRMRLGNIEIAGQSHKDRIQCANRLLVFTDEGKSDLGNIGSGIVPRYVILVT